MHMMMMKHKHMGMHHHPPYGLLIFPITMVMATVASVMIAKRMMFALETLALANALDKMDERLSDVERADIEGRIRERLFMEGHFGCCGH